MNFGRKKKIILYGAILLGIVILLNCYIVKLVSAQEMNQGLENFANITGYQQAELTEIIARTIKIILGFLGLVAVIIIIWGGITWMTSKGEPEKVTKAKKIIISGLIGLALVVFSYAIATFIVGKLLEIAGGDIEGQPCEITCSCSGCYHCGSDKKYHYDPDYCCPPGGKTFIVTNIQPSPNDVITIRNTVIRIYFNRPVDPGTVSSDTILIQKTDVEPPVEVSGTFELQSNKVVKFTPDAACPEPHEEWQCFDENSYFRVETLAGQVRSIDDNLPLDCTNGKCIRSFFTNDIVDTESPDIQIIKFDPSQGNYIPKQDSVVVTARATDDSGIAQVNFYIDNEAEPRAILTEPDPGTEDEYSFSWDTSDLVLGQTHSVKAQAFDLDENEDSHTRNVIIRAFHCFNGVQDEDEEGTDCGGVDCGACNGAPCDLDPGTIECEPDDDMCASGYCDETTCTCQGGSGPGWDCTVEGACDPTLCTSFVYNRCIDTNEDNTCACCCTPDDPMTSPNENTCGDLVCDITQDCGDEPGGGLCCGCNEVIDCRTNEVCDEETSCCKTCQGQADTTECYVPVGHGECCNELCCHGYCIEGECITTCGNEQLEGNEQCDLTAIPSFHEDKDTCPEVAPKYIGGTLGCNPDCTFDTSDCRETGEEGGAGEACQYETVCQTGAESCISPYNCIVGGTPTDCRCCCAPMVLPDECPSPLECTVGQSPCTGEARGLCCGCVNDEQCQELGAGKICDPTNKCCYPFPKPENLIITERNLQQIKLEWQYSKEAFKYVDKFEIWRAGPFEPGQIPGEDDYSNIDTIVANCTEGEDIYNCSYINSGAFEIDKSYFYKIQARHGTKTAYSGFSNSAEAEISGEVGCTHNFDEECLVEPCNFCSQNSPCCDIRTEQCITIDLCEFGVNCRIAGQCQPPPAKYAEADFTVTDDPDIGPCLYKVTPESGQWGAPVRLTGLRFGDEQDISGGNPGAVDDSDDMAVFLDSQNNGRFSYYHDLTWGDPDPVNPGFQKIDTLVAYDLADGWGWVAVHKHQGFKFSNWLRFKIERTEGGPGEECKIEGNTYCEIGVDICSTPYECLINTNDQDCRCCCQPNEEPDTCKVLSESLECTPDMPPCDESDEERGLCCGCQVDADCGEGNGCSFLDPNRCCRQRPTVEFDAGTCLNTNIKIEFGQLMDYSSLNKDNIKVYKDCLPSDYLVKKEEPKENVSILAKVINFFKNIVFKFARAQMMLPREPIIPEAPIIWGPGEGWFPPVSLLPSPGEDCLEISGHIKKIDVEGNTIVTFSPIGCHLDPETEYWVFVRGGFNGQGVRSRMGVSIGEAATWSFTTGEEGDYCDIETIYVHPAEAEINQPEETLDYSAYAFDEYGNSICITEVYWSSEDVGVATVTPDAEDKTKAIVRAEGEGETQIKAELAVAGYGELTVIFTGLKVEEDSTCNFSEIPPKLPSPNPQPNAQEVCTNIALSARFNMAIDRSTILNELTPNPYDYKNALVEKCTEPTCEITEEIFGVEKWGMTLSDDNKTFVLTPGDFSGVPLIIESLEPNTTYQITVSGGLVGIKSQSGQRMEENYIWQFTTRNDASLCVPDHVWLDPVEAIIGSLEPPDNTQGYMARPIGPNCWILTGDYEWFWNSTDQDVAILQKETDIGPFSTNTAEAVDWGETYIEAITLDITGRGHLIVAPFPEVEAYYPADGATDVCPNGLIWAQFNQQMDKATLTLTNIGLYKEQTDACQEQGQGSRVNGTYLCPVDISLDILTETKVNIKSPLLDLETYYWVIIKGGENGVKSKYNAPLVDDFSWRFETWDKVCTLDKVEMYPSSYLFTIAGEEKLFEAWACTKRPGFTGSLECGHGYEPISANWQWSKEDSQEVISEANSTTNSQSITAENKNGRAILTVEAASWGVTRQASAALEVFLCENPWPGNTGSSYEDSEEPATNFRVRYCMDGDLPNFSYLALAGSDDLIKEFIFKNPDNDDIVGIRVFSNPRHLSPTDWFKEKFPGQSVSNYQNIDGYLAAISGKTIYVLAPNIVDSAIGPQKIYTNIYLITYTGGAGQPPSAETTNIFGQLVANWQFNINLEDAGVKKELARDIQRILDFDQIGQQLETYYSTYNEYPTMEAGTYKVGYTCSKWPSWQETLGAAIGGPLPVDPINEFVVPCAGCFDALSYWQFDEGSGIMADDFSENNNDGTLVNFDFYGDSNWVDGKFGKALSFDGIDDYVEVPNSLDYSTGRFSVMAWVRPDDISDCRNSIVSSKESGGGFVLAQPEGACDKFRIWAFINNGWHSVDSFTTISPGRWYHVGATYDGLVLKIYVNGFLDNTYPISGAINNPSIFTIIGAFRHHARAARIEDFYKGIIDDVIIYNRGLTEEEVSAHYQHDLDFDCNGTCYNEETKIFDPRNGSHFYQYKAIGGYSLCTNMEYYPDKNVRWIGQPTTISINQADETTICNWEKTQGGEVPIP